MYQRLNPKPILKDLISFYWVGELQRAPLDEFLHRDVARSAAQLILHYEGSFSELDCDGNVTKSPLFRIHGQRTSNKQYICSSEKSGIFGIKLSSVAIPLLFSIPAYELTNQTLELTDVLGKQGAELMETLYTAKSTQERIDAVSSLFEKKLQRATDKYIRTQMAVQYINRVNGHLSIKDLVDMSCLSQRQFQRSFKELTGYSAKMYLKLIRFENAVRNYSPKYNTLTDVASASGYFDQAHFNHDFKLFTGLTPSEYFGTQLSSKQ
jgi:AraC-like DNA-binding protein